MDRYVTHLGTRFGKYNKDGKKEQSLENVTNGSWGDLFTKEGGKKKKSKKKEKKGFVSLCLPLASS